MKYKAGNRRKASEYEPALVEWWKKNKTFEKSVENRPIDDSYVFYDGPPFITGMPHHGTLLSSIVKDAVPRFWTMRGKRVERRWGWDCHGLPAENFVEKQLGITDRREIDTDASSPRTSSSEPASAPSENNSVVKKISLEDYILKARESMVANSETWEGTIDRIGRWVDFKGAYRTMNKDFMESVWWAFKTLYEAGKIYEGRKVLMYDTKFATPVSKSEVTMDNDAYQTVTDPSAYVKFKMSEVQNSAGLALSGDFVLDDNVYFLAWTTTPWTLPANAGLAVNPELEYAGYEVNNEILIVLKSCGEKLFEGRKPEFTVLGERLVGVIYDPLLGVYKGEDLHQEETNFVVHGADFVSDTDGTGIVHIAPAYGEDDYQLLLAEKQNNERYHQEYMENTDRYPERPLLVEMSVIDVLDEYGYYLPEVAEKLHKLGVRDTDGRGIENWAGNKFIAKCLEEAGIVWKIEYIKHEYPFNPRSKQRIMYRAFPSWFFDVQGQKELMIAQNENINWFPEYLKHGRFEKNIEQAPDWNLSRDRFWATAMPVWKGDKGTVKVVGSYAELKELSGVELEDYHRPWVDEIEFNIDGEHFKRIDKVLDCWFESGSMPFAQLHYPFKNKEKFERNYPADFIVEYVGQVRAWFYYVHAVNTALAEVGGFGEAAQARTEKNAFKNVITTGTLAGNDGRKMSKSLGNYTDPNELMNKFSADALRFLLLSSPVLSGEDFALTDKDVSDVNRKLAMIWNVYDFFTTYAEVDNWESPEDSHWQGELENPLDKWIIARLHELKRDVTAGMEEYNIPKALSGVLPFVDDLSNWFVRRSRRRFWKSEDDGDKAEAYWTLWKVLSKLAQVLAPFTPFLAEELWQKMMGGDDPEKSVHLTDWTEAGEIDEEILEQMAQVREVINEGLMLRMRKSETEEQVKVRQPLAKLVYAGEELPEWGIEIVKDEVNVKLVEQGEEAWIDKGISEELAREGFARELVRAVQAARKKAGLIVDDRIRLSVSEDVPAEWVEMLKNETLATELTQNQNYAYDEIVKVGDKNVTISLEKE